MEKTAYVAARFTLKGEVREIYSKLEELGYSISEDWTRRKTIRPYTENQKLAEEYTVADIKGAIESDLFIMINDEFGTGMHSELGAAIVQFLKEGKPIIYVIGEHLNTSPFFFHSAVRRKETIDDVIKELKE